MENSRTKLQFIRAARDFANRDSDLVNC
jgi:hypothetical protein